MYRRPKPPICLSAEQTTQQRDQGGADQGDTAALALCAGVVVAIAFQQVDDTPNTETGTQSDNEGLKHFDSRVKEIHSHFLLRKKSLWPVNTHLKSQFFFAANRSMVDLLVYLGPGKEKSPRVWEDPGKEKSPRVWEDQCIALIKEMIMYTPP